MKLLPITLPARPKGLRFQSLALVDGRFEVAAADATITIYDTIGADTTPNRIAAALRSIGDQPVTVRLNSPGGDAFDGVAIFNLLRGHSQPIAVEIVGLAASSASIIAMSGDTIGIAPGAQLMVHRASGLGFGNSDDMRATSSALEKLDAAMASIYAGRTGLPLDRIVSMMSDETYFSSDEAIGLGFCDSLLTGRAAPAPKLAAAQTFTSKGDLEDGLRRSGFSGGVAARIAAGGFPALTTTTGGVDVPSDFTESVQRFDNTITQMATLKGLFQ